MKIVRGLPPEITTGSVALDLEIFNANPKQLHRPFGEFACLSISDGETVWVVEDVKDVPKVVRRIDKAVWVFHNASFDIAHLRRWANIKPRSALLFWDTFLIERLLWNGYYDDFALDDLARRYLNIRLSKEQRPEFYDAKFMTWEMVQYAAMDAYVTYKIHREQGHELMKDPQLWSVWEDIDAPAFWAVQDFKGLMLDIPAWKSLAVTARKRAEEIRLSLGFNPNSPKQAKEALAKEGIDLDSTKEEFLLAYSHNPVVAGILEYRENVKLSGTYGENVIEYVEVDGRIHHNYKITGAITGRMACSDPNAQNVPHAKIYRACFIAGPGNKMIIADVSAQEPKITGEVTRDKNLLDAFERGEDIHWSVTRMIFDLPPNAPKDKELRRIGKATFLGVIYGQTAIGLSKKLGCSKAKATEYIDALYARLTGVRLWVVHQREEVQRTGVVRTLSGRRQFINPNSWQWPNHAINTVHQGTAADQIKIALAWLHNKYGKDMPICAVVHDELVAETSEELVEQVAGDIVEALEYASKKLTPHVTTKNLVEVSIGNNWGDKV